MAVHRIESVLSTDGSNMTSAAGGWEEIRGRPLHGGYVGPRPRVRPRQRGHFAC